MRAVPFAVSLLAAAAAQVVAAEICTSDNNEFHAEVDLFAGELGYYKFTECGDTISPTLGLEVGQVYTFYQTDRKNYMHPLGFAYFPDGAHEDKDELEPTVTQGTSSCSDTASCPAPMYFVDGEYQGTYSNNANVLAATVGEDNFGLDAYEPQFYHPVPEWSSKEFSVQLNFSDTTYDQDIFYFCHIHNHMSGRIKLLSNGEPINSEDSPEIPYTYDQPSDYDKQCGTFSLSDYQLPNDQCPVAFVCNANEDIAELAECYSAANCHMMAGMTTAASSDDAVALFVHQMIPHHQNAVNTAKALLYKNVLQCDDLTEETDDCVMEGILRNIINGQNMEIQAMRAYLEDKGFVAEDDCKIDITSTISENASAAAVTLASSWLLLVALALFV